MKSSANFKGENELQHIIQLSKLIGEMPVAALITLAFLAVIALAAFSIHSMVTVVKGKRR